MIILIKKGMDGENVIRLVKYAAKLSANGLPILFELQHLSYILGYDKVYLYKVMYDPKQFYREFRIAGRKKIREIHSPYPLLAYAQKWIKENILENAKVSDAAYGYVKSRSVVDNAKRHFGQNELLKLDIKHFFSSISLDQVEHVFETLGYTPKLSYQLAKICCLNFSLPQGAPTSPILSNIVFRELDLKLIAMAEREGLIYSRYADDMAFSGDKIRSEFIVQVNQVIKDNGYDLNHAKFAHKKRGQHKFLNGLSISGSEIRVLKKTRRLFRQKYHYLRIYRANALINQSGDFDILMLDRVIGLGNYILHVEPKNRYVADALKELIHLKKTLFIKPQ